MGSNQFAETLVEVMLSWMRLLVDWFWSVFRSGAPTGLGNWFANHWMGIVVVLVVIGVVADWLVWMIRWRPYWLWFRKKQIIYEDEETQPRKKNVRVERPQDIERFRGTRSVDKDDFEDPFAMPEPAIAPKARFSGWDCENDPYAAPAKKSKSRYAEWDSEEDPYAAAEDANAPFRRPSGN